jgi:hypothetical protein
MRRLSAITCALFSATLCPSLHAEGETALHPASAEAPAKTVQEFQPFTGIVRGSNVRVRLHPDLEGHIVQQLNKDDLVLVRGEEGSFWEVEPPTKLKAYVFRSFILDNVVEGSRVNVRLEPSLEAPVIAHLNSGDKVEGVPSAANSKWLEIDAPLSTRLFIAKDFIEYKGPVELKAKLDKRRSAAEKQFEAAVAQTKSEFRKPFDEINIQKLTQQYTAIIRDYKDLPQYIEQATEALASLQDIYLQKKVAFLEARATSAATPAQAPIIDQKIETKEPEIVEHDADIVEEITDKMRAWLQTEESLYVTWATLNNGASMAEYFEEQQQSAIPLTGILEAYTAAVKNKPGDYILRDKSNIPIAYLYSTELNLEKYVGQHVSFRAVPRSNNNFAFPAYLVISTN